MQRPNNILPTLIFATVLFCSCGSHRPKSSDQDVFNEIQKSHIDANVPEKSKFDATVTRDLEKYFQSIYGKVTVKWEFLRDGATQSGVAYPKYYIWTRVYQNEQLLNEGATRLAAIEKSSFKITDFVSISDIRNKTRDIYQIFPEQVCEKIKSRL